MGVNFFRVKNDQTRGGGPRGVWQKTTLFPNLFWHYSLLQSRSGKLTTIYPSANQILSQDLCNPFQMKLDLCYSTNASPLASTVNIAAAISTNKAPNTYFSPSNFPKR